MSEQLFIKLMMMTTSPHDGEVLTAIRKANAILAGQNLNWEEFIMQMGAAPAPEPEPFVNHDEWSDVGVKTRSKRGHDTSSSQNTYGGPGVDKIFDSLLNEFHLADSFKEFVEDVQRYYQDKGYITQRQYEALKNAYGKRRR